MTDNKPAKYTHCGAEDCKRRVLRPKLPEHDFKLRGHRRIYPAGTPLCGYHHEPAHRAPCAFCGQEFWRFDHFGWNWLKPNGQPADVLFRSLADQSGDPRCHKCKQLLPVSDSPMAQRYARPPAASPGKGR